MHIKYSFNILEMHILKVKNNLDLNIFPPKINIKIS